jgi:hypothetical protein
VRIALLLGLLLTILPAKAEAFCGFYVSGASTELLNDATMVVLLRAGQRTVLSMQNNYRGPPEDFAMVVPVPVVLHEKDVKTLPHALFDRVDTLAAPRLVEYWEQDPCDSPERERYFATRSDDRSPMAAAAPAGAAVPQVVIEAQFAVGEYDIVILSANDSTALERWLRDNGYAIPDNVEPLLRPYVEGGSKFFVAKVDVQKVAFKAGRAKLSPLRFHYDTNDFTLPIRLGLINAGAKQDLIVHILGNGRFEAANYPNTFIPSNVEVADEVRHRFGEFYAALFDAVLDEAPGSVVTEYSWSARSCDPCPGPVLSSGDLQLLGSDVTLQLDTSHVVLTRLHARYDADSLGEDLVFRSAKPVAGGRGTQTGLSTEATPAHINTFQGRYIIRHYWPGPVTCGQPARGRWGAPPPGYQNRGTRAAKDLALAARGNIQLADVVHVDLPRLKIVTGFVPPAERKNRVGLGFLLGFAAGLIGLGTAALRRKAPRPR